MNFTFIELPLQLKSESLHNCSRLAFNSHYTQQCVDFACARMRYSWIIKKICKRKVPNKGKSEKHTILMHRPAHGHGCAQKKWLLRMLGLENFLACFAPSIILMVNYKEEEQKAKQDCSQLTIITLHSIIRRS